MHAAEQPEPGVPPRRRLDDVPDARVVRELPQQPRVQRRTAVGLRGLVEKDLAMIRWAGQAVSSAVFSSAAFACSATAANAGGSLTARSASTLRSSSISAFLQAGHELVVREPVLARGSVDADDPERAHRPLAVLAVPVGVDERVLDLLLRGRVARVLEPPVPARFVQHLAALLARGDGTLDSRHRLAPPQKLLDRLLRR